MKLREEELAAALPELLEQHWLIVGATVEAIPSSLTSAVAKVTQGQRHYSAKWVPNDQHGHLIRAARLNSRLAASGMRIGDVLTTIDDQIAAPIGGGWVTLDMWAPGVPVDGRPEEIERMGFTLGRAHRATLLPQRGKFIPSWLVYALPDYAPDWLVEARARLLTRYASLPDLDLVALHNDPRPSAFIAEEDGAMAIVDWCGTEEGPALLDIAGAVCQLPDPDSAVTWIRAYRGFVDIDEAHWEFLDFFTWMREVAYAARLVRRPPQGEWPFCSQREVQEQLQQRRAFIENGFR